MAINSAFPLIFFTLTLLTTTTTTVAAAVDTTTTVDTTTVPIQIDDIISAIISAGDFENWSTLISKTPSLLPLNFTVFIPTTAAENTTSPPFKENPFSYEHQTFISYNQDFILHHNNSSFFTKNSQELRSYSHLLYHIVPYRLSFEELVRLPVLTRLPTLLPGTTLLITANNNHSVSCRFAIDGSCVTLPDLYQDESSFAHGVADAFDYTAYGDETSTTEEPMMMMIKKGVSWDEFWREMWGFPAILMAHWIFMLNPHQLFIVIMDYNRALLEQIRQHIEGLRKVARAFEERREASRRKREEEERQRAAEVAELARQDAEAKALSKTIERIWQESEERIAESNRVEAVWEAENEKLLNEVEELKAENRKLGKGKGKGRQRRRGKGKTTLSSS